MFSDIFGLPYRLASLLIPINWTTNDLIVGGRKAKKSSNREKIGNKPIPSPMCPKWCPITPLRMVRRTAGCNMVISGWVWSIVRKFVTSFRKELGRPEKSITGQNHDIGGSRVQKY